MAASRKLIVHCLLPPAAADLLDDVRAHYAQADPRVQVVMERRVKQRRQSLEPTAKKPDRRTGTDRRRFVVPRHLAPLPNELSELIGPVRWVQRLPAVTPATEALSTDEVITAVREGDPEAPTELYWRFYERVHSRLSVLLSDPAEVDATVPQAFGAVLDALETPGTGDTAFEALLYSSIDAVAATVLGERGRQNHGPAGGLGIQDHELDEAVRVREADPAWSTKGRVERDRLLEVLGDHVVSIEHVGSTAVPHVAGRNTIDLMAGVHRLPLAHPAMIALEDAGYEDCGDGGTPGRLYLRRRGRLRVDLHLVEFDGPLWHDTLGFRDFLRRHPGEATRWSTVKRDAARAAPTSAVRYYDLRRLALDELLERSRRDARSRHAAAA
jgi:GrpB-like predicted nucleotidyltransferase (UPF0157 family)